MKEKIKRIDDLSSNVWAEGASSLSSSSSGTSERVEKSIRFYWKELKCNKLYPSNRNVFEDPEDSTSTVNSGASSFQHTSHRRTEEIVQNNIITKDRCREWMNTHHVVSGHSWGTLPLDLQK